MFKKPKKLVDATASGPGAEAEQPAKSSMQIEAERAVARGERIRSVSSEVEMWRKFEKGCKAGRYVMENVQYSAVLRGMDPQSMLVASMDND